MTNGPHTEIDWLCARTLTFVPQGLGIDCTILEVNSYLLKALRKVFPFSSLPRREVCERDWPLVLMTRWIVSKRGASFLVVCRESLVFILFRTALAGLTAVK